MFRSYARAQGLEDGAQDALAKRPARPRPSFSLSVLSGAYLSEYQSAYRLAYAQAERRCAQTVVRDAERAERKRRDRVKTLLANRPDHLRDLVRDDRER